MRRRWTHPPRHSIVKSQSGEFTRAKGREVRGSFLKPGVGITIVSIDAVRSAFDAMVAGKLNRT